MPRQARKESFTGIFHVMMRGINHQKISDLRSSLLTLDKAQASLALYSLNRTDLRSSLLTLDKAQASLALYSLNRSLEEHEDYYQFLNTLDMMAQ